jgi:hypothetical protein
MQPYYLVVRPEVTLPYSIYERDELAQLTDLQRSHSRILLDSFGKRMTALSLFQFVFAVHNDVVDPTILERYLSFKSNSSEAADSFYFIQTDLKELFLFVTCGYYDNHKIRMFMNWTYTIINTMFPDLLSDYTIVPQKDQTFILEKE